MASLQRNATIYIAAAGLNAVIPFLVLPLLARWLGPEGIGRVGTYLALVNLAAVLVGLSTHGLISVVHFRDGASSVPAQVGASLRVLAYTTAPVLALLLLLATPLDGLAGISPAWGWTIAMAAAGQFIVGIGLAVFQAREEPWRYGALQVGLSLGWAALSLALVGSMNWGWTGRAAGQVFGAATLAFVTLIWLGRAGLLQWQSGRAPVRAAFRFGLPLVPHSLAAAAMGSADRLVLSGVSGAHSTGQYFAAFQIAAVLSVAGAAVNQAWVPWLYRRLAAPTPAGLRAAVQASYLMMFGWLAAAALLMATAPWVVRQILGPQYDLAGSLLRWLAPAAAFSGMYYFVTNYLFYTGRTGVLSMLTVACALLQFGLLFVLVPLYGAEGAAIAALVTSLVHWASIWAAAQWAMPMPWSLRGGNPAR